MSWVNIQGRDKTTSDFIPIQVNSNGSLVDSVAEPENVITAYLENGGSNDMGVDGSSTPVTFSFTPTSGFNFKFVRFLLYFEANTAFDSEKFMNLTALTNGVDVKISGNTISNWKDNIDVLTDMFDLSSAGAVFGKETKSMSGRWTLQRTASAPIWVADTESVAFVINDDLSAANIIFRAKVQGVLSAA